MRRRDVLRFAGAASALAVAGCVSNDNGGGETDDESDTPESTPTPTPTPVATESSGDGESNEGDDDDDQDTETESTGEYAYEDPTEAVRAFVRAFQEGDVDAFLALISDSGDLDFDRDEIDAEELKATAPEIKNITVVENDGDTARLEVKALPPEEESAVTDTFKLEKIDGAWRIVNIKTEDSGPEQVAPRSNFEFEADDGSMEITLTAGDSVPADELYVRGDGVDPTGVWHELDDGGEDDTDSGDDVKVGYAVTVDIEETYSIQVVWEADDASATLATVSGESESTSESDSDDVDTYLSAVENYDGSIEDFTHKEAVTVMVGEGSDEEFVFDPPAIRIETGTTVTWEWSGDTPHSVTHEEEAFNSEVKSGDGTTFEYTFEESGTYLYYCIPHKSLGMKGALVVE